MRRKERELRDREAVEAILKEGQYATLSLSKAGQPYAIPMNYGYRWEEEGLTFYFHCAREGEKLAILKENPRACLSVVASEQVYSPDPTQACSYSSYFRSFVAEGNISLVNDLAEKVDALGVLMGHYAPEGSFSFGERECNMVTVLRLKARIWSAKAHTPKVQAEG